MYAHGRERYIVENFLPLDCDKKLHLDWFLDFYKNQKSSLRISNIRHIHMDIRQDISLHMGTVPGLMCTPPNSHSYNLNPTHSPRSKLEMLQGQPIHTKL